jgi:hypothetical protein
MAQVSLSGVHTVVDTDPENPYRISRRTRPSVSRRIGGGATQPSNGTLKRPADGLDGDEGPERSPYSRSLADDERRLVHHWPRMSGAQCQ